MKRRTFFSTASLGLSGLSGFSVRAQTALGRPEAPTASDGPARKLLSLSQWRCLETVQEHLLPSEPQAPGSRDIRATAYLDRTLADPGFDPDFRSLILRGILWLENLAHRREGRAFYQVPPGRREALLQEIAQDPMGERWLALLIDYTLEALLADPLYGGNPNGIGWQWLGHDPGRPRPTPDKIYGALEKI